MPIRMALLALLLLVPAAAQADTLLVANDGVDSGTCGGKGNPCRTISAAMANALDGDTIVVGPGRYGDLNANGVLGEAEEEPVAACSCVVFVTKTLEIVSRSGAESTVIEAGGVAIAVFMDSSDGILGEPGGGFTVSGAGSTGVDVRGSRNRVAGNIVAGNGEIGVRVFVTATVVGNTAIGNGDAGFFVPFGSGSNLIGNRSIGHGTGFLIFESNVTLIGNVATAAETNGFHLSESGHLLEGNIANGNADAGLFVQEGASGQTIRGNSFVGNGGPGIRLEGPPAEISGNNIFGNDPAGNCGVFNDSDAQVAAPGNFWGATDGPGGAPADNVCDEPGSTTVVDSVASKEFKLKLKPPK